MAGWKRWAAIAAGVGLGVPALLCAGTGAAGLFLDGAVSLEVVEVLDVPPDAVWDHLDDAAGIAAWWDHAMAAYAAQHGGGAAMEVVHVAGSPEAGPGCRVDFVAGGMVAESWEILALEPGRRAVYDIDFQVMRVERTLTLAPEGAGTRLTWTERGEIGNPWIRVLASASGGSEGAEANFRGAMKALGDAAR